MTTAQATKLIKASTDKLAAIGIETDPNLDRLLSEAKHENGDNLFSFLLDAWLSIDIEFGVGEAVKFKPFLDAIGVSVKMFHDGEEFSDAAKAIEIFEAKANSFRSGRWKSDSLPPKSTREHDYKFFTKMAGDFAPDFLSILYFDYVRSRTFEDFLKHLGISYTIRKIRTSPQPKKPN